MTMQTKRRQLIRILSPLHPLCKHFIPICAGFVWIQPVSAFVIIFVLALFLLSCHALLVWLMVSLVVLSPFAIAALAYFQICCFFYSPFFSSFFMNWLPQLSFHFLSLLLHWPTFTFAFTFSLTLAEFFFSHPYTFYSCCITMCLPRLHIYLDWVLAQPAWLKYKIESGLIEYKKSKQ